MGTLTTLGPDAVSSARRPLVSQTPMARAVCGARGVADSPGQAGRTTSRSMVLVPRRTSINPCRWATVTATRRSLTPSLR